jgi:hypothetical protein
MHRIVEKSQRFKLVFAARRKIYFATSLRCFLPVKKARAKAAKGRQILSADAFSAAIFSPGIRRESGLAEARIGRAKSPAPRIRDVRKSTHECVPGCALSAASTPVGTTIARPPGSRKVGLATCLARLVTGARRHPHRRDVSSERANRRRKKH